MKVRGEKLRYAARDSLQCLPTVSPKSPVQGGAGRGYESEETKESDANEKGERTRETECSTRTIDRTEQAPRARRGSS